MNKIMTSSYKTSLHSSTTVIKAEKENSKGGKDDDILPVKWEEINYWKEMDKSLIGLTYYIKADYSFEGFIHFNM